jgi:hypothetical protein
MPQVIHLTETPGISISTVINRTDFNLYRDVSNEIDFLIKTIDRKPVNLTDRIITFFLIDDHSGKVLLKQLITNISDDLAGHRRLLINPILLVDIDLGYYRYVITQTMNGIESIIYSDQNRSINGFVELFSGPVPEQKPAITITTDEFVMSSWGLPLTTYRLAQSYKGAAQTRNSLGCHTIAIYTTNFSGLFQVQASLENSTPSVDSDWFDVGPGITISEESNITGYQFTGQYIWVRFFYSGTSGNTGTVDRVLYKN